MPPNPMSLDVQVPAAEPSSPGRHADDVALSRRVLEGDVRAWEQFIQRYAGLMYTVIGRQLRTTDVDDIRSVLVDVLVVVRTSKLRGYEGRAALSTWLAVVARSEALDFLRRRYGRPRYQRRISRLGSTDRFILRMYHFEGRTPHEVVAALGQRGEAFSVDEVIEKIRMLEHHLGSGWMDDAAYELHARNVRLVSARMLAYLDFVRDEHERRVEAESPEYRLMEKEAREMACRLAEHIGRLEPAERQLIELRFDRGRTADQIARDLGLAGPRAVYTMMERVLRKIRRWLAGGEGDRG